MARKHKDILEPGSTFGRYTIKRRLGRGGMGAVYEAVHSGLDKRVAIKALHPEMAQEPEVQTRFLREGKSAARIKHPHVVDIYDVGTIDDITYLEMEYLDGQDLSHLLKQEGTLGVAQAVDLILPVTAALLTAHEAGVIHRDLKPANIFLANGPHGMMIPKVLDFGISKMSTNQPSDDLTTTGALLGTPYYMSPEQAAGSKMLDARSDQYSVGVILYQAVTGKKPFLDDSMYKILHRIVQGEFDPPRSVRPELPESFERVLLKAMATKPDDRYPTLKELGQALLVFANKRVRSRWEPIFGVTMESADLPSTYSTAKAAPTAAALAEPISVTRNEASGALGSQTLAAAGGSKKLLVGGAIALALAVVAVGYVSLSTEQSAPVATKLEPPPPPPPPIERTTFDVKVAVVPATAKLTLDGQLVGTGRFEKTLPKDGKSHTLLVEADGHTAKTIVFADAAPPDKIELSALPKQRKPNINKRRPQKRVVEKAPPPPAKPQAKKGANDALIIR